ncbi:HAD-IIIC family phosphatase [uncultured Helicobacter sp.]|uniref:HAD-IIIC family phosphatase n=1 Tax=uncultured Helicobacter sp. TaxID=175537 RepID=UPI00272CCD77|nr:HAD-IIIC family phosphatase [uncultured Helicobacter sp.]
MQMTQYDIFSMELKRTALLSLAKHIPLEILQSIHINIHRNHAFEPIQSVIAPFLHYAGLKAHFHYSDYDDSLSFSSLASQSHNADLEIIYIDKTRYNLDNVAFLQFRKERSLALRTLTKAPIMIALLDDSTFATLLESQYAHDIQSLQNQHIFCFSLYALYTQREQFITLESHHLIDEAKESISGTRLSNYGSLAIAQILGLKLIPALTLPTLKAIVCDLDNTLYGGILGEDGINSLQFTPSHIALQKQLLEYKKQGFLLALCSKNESQDAMNLFATRKDFPLSWNDFDNTQVNWKPKYENLLNIAQSFNIGVDSLLFIDDNIAEIESIKHIGAKYIHALSPQNVLWKLFLFPQMTKLHTNKEDSLRANDIAANTQRKNLQSLDTETYFENLAITLSFSLNNTQHTQRIYELMNKTNQFIASYTRPTLPQAQEWLDSKHFCVLSIAMSDRLSDSGIIGIIIGEYKEAQKEIHIIDIVVSCRALGRRLETLMLNYAFYLITENLSPSIKDSKKRESTSHSVFLHYQKGERNAPFLQTLSQLAHLSKEHYTHLQPMSAQTISIPITKPDMQGLHIHLT